ncbi:MAG: hypothetical protein IR153_06165 [Flavobacterium sp.]|nr:hypothetical protein [Flavobacterium sp.]
MKQKLESELISIAHRILKLKNKAELDQLHTETRVLYEKLSILKFVEENFEGPKPTIGRYDVESKIDALSIVEPAKDVSRDNQEKQPDLPAQPQAPEPEVEPKTEDEPEIAPETPVEPEVEETPNEVETPPQPEQNNDDSELIAPTEIEKVSEVELEETLSEDDSTADHKPDDESKEVAPEQVSAKDTSAEKSSEDSPSTEMAENAAENFDPIFKPAFEWSHDEKSNETKKEEKPTTSGQIAFEDLLGTSYVDPVFVKPEELETERRNIAVKLDLNQAQAPERLQSNDDIAHKVVSLNDRLSKGITVGLNDRIAFVKHLFNNSTEDYNRVLSQLITFDSFAEAQEFIDQMVKPDYNDWHGKDEYAARFMELIEKKFS